MIIVYKYACAVSQYDSIVLKKTRQLESGLSLDTVAVYSVVRAFTNHDTGRVTLELEDGSKITGLSSYTLVPIVGFGEEG